MKNYRDLTTKTEHEAVEKYLDLLKTNRALGEYIDFAANEVGEQMLSGPKITEMRRLMMDMLAVLQSEKEIPQISRENLESAIAETREARWNTKFNSEVYNQFCAVARGPIIANPQLEKYVFGMYDMIEKQRNKSKEREMEEVK